MVLAWIALLAAVIAIAVGALVVGRGIDEALDAAPGAEPASLRWRVVAGASAAALALLTSTFLSVYEPGGRRRRESERSAGVDPARPRSSDG